MCPWSKDCGLTGQSTDVICATARPYVQTGTAVAVPRASLCILATAEWSFGLQYRADAAWVCT